MLYLCSRKSRRFSGITRVVSIWIGAFRRGVAWMIGCGGRDSMRGTHVFVLYCLLFGLLFLFLWLWVVRRFYEPK
jgi:hypothetical protein